MSKDRRQKEVKHRNYGNKSSFSPNLPFCLRKDWLRKPAADSAALPHSLVLQLFWTQANEPPSPWHKPRKDWRVRARKTAAVPGSGWRTVLPSLEDGLDYPPTSRTTSLRVSGPPGMPAAAAESSCHSRARLEPQRHRPAGHGWHHNANRKPPPSCRQLAAAAPSPAIISAEHTGGKRTASTEFSP